MCHVDPLILVLCRLIGLELHAIMAEMVTYSFIWPRYGWNITEVRVIHSLLRSCNWGHAGLVKALYPWISYDFVWSLMILCLLNLVQRLQKQIKSGLGFLVCNLHGILKWMFSSDSSCVLIIVVGRTSVYSLSFVQIINLHVYLFLTACLPAWLPACMLVFNFYRGSTYALMIWFTYQLNYLVQEPVLTSQFWRRPNFEVWSNTSIYTKTRSETFLRQVLI